MFWRNDERWDERYKMNVTGWECEEKISVFGIYIFDIFRLIYILFPYIDGRLFEEHNVRRWTANSGSKDVCWQMPAVDVVISDLLYISDAWRHTVTLAWICGSEGIKSIAVSAEKLYWHSTKRWTRSVKFGGSGHSSWILQASLSQLMILLCFSWGIWFMLCEQ